MDTRNIYNLVTQDMQDLLSYSRISDKDIYLGMSVISEARSTFDGALYKGLLSNDRVVPQKPYIRIQRTVRENLNRGTNQITPTRPAGSSGNAQEGRWSAHRKAGSIAAGAAAAILTGAGAVTAGTFSLHAGVGKVEKFDFALPSPKKAYAFMDQRVPAAVSLDVTLFLNAMPKGVAVQNVLVDFDEVTLEWKSDSAHAQVTFEGDGMFTYAMLRGKFYAPGAIDGASVFIFPQDLADYILSI